MHINGKELSTPHKRQFLGNEYVTMNNICAVFKKSVIPTAMISLNAKL